MKNMFLGLLFLAVATVGAVSVPQAAKAAWKCSGSAEFVSLLNTVYANIGWPIRIDTLDEDCNPVFLD